MNQALSVDNLVLGFDRSRPILTDVSFSIEVGSFVVVSGKNGTGKSLLLKCLKGLLQPESGTIRIGDQDLTKKPKRRNEILALVFQDADTQIVGQTVERDILFGMENLGIDLDQRKERLKQVSELLSLDHLLHHRPRTLSGGERRKLAIAGVLVMHPQVVLLDEPFANLDYLGIVSVLEALVALHRKGTTIVVATHEIEKLLAHADSLIVLDDRTVVRSGPPRTIIESIHQYGLRRPMHQHLPIAVEEMTWLN